MVFDGELRLVVYLLNVYLFLRERVSVGKGERERHIGSEADSVLTA